ncbi:MAG TPA: alpha/beta hydrolase [Longimicrobiales bacterium]|nr:alpha/beta hydrolase [Longimicrobiales bacterium]
MRRLTAALAGLWAWAGLAQAQEPPRYITAGEAIAWAPRPYDARVSYGADPLQYGELRLPAGQGPFPVAVVVHGGCWLSIADNDYMDPVAERLTQAGWATWNLEFRRIDEPGGAWPGIFRDVAGGTDFLRSLAGDYPLDLDHVVTVGHSSGGHLALWLSARGRIAADAELYDEDPLPIHGVVSLAGIADLAHYHEMRVPACGDTPSRLLGGVAPTDSPRTAQASPAALLPTDVPQILITGDDDYAVPPAHGEAYAALAVRRGQEAVHHVIPNSSHFEIVAPESKPWQDAWVFVEPFLNRIRR